MTDIHNDDDTPPNTEIPTRRHVCAHEHTRKRADTHTQTLAAPTGSKVQLGEAAGAVR